MDTIPVRYGVFMTPDPATSAAVTQVTGFIKAQYGLVSAGAFPPHATLAGSLPISDETALVDALDAALRTQAAVPVENHGVRTISRSALRANVRVLGDIVIYDINDIGPSRNEALRTLALNVNEVVRPLLASTSGLTADTHDGTRFHAHLSLASHELYERPDLRDEIATYASALPVTAPPHFVANTITLYRLQHPTWSGPWWTDMTWTHHRTWHLPQP